MTTLLDSAEHAYAAAVIAAPPEIDGGVMHTHRAGLAAALKVLVAVFGQTFATRTVLQPISTAPRDRFIIVYGPSGCRTEKLRGEICIWENEPEAWVTPSGFQFTDRGKDPTHWSDIPAWSE
jgi:hypothetical protein